MKVYKLFRLGLVVSVLTWSFVYASNVKTEVAEKYPINTCIVSGKKLGSMGDPFKYEYNGRIVMFCCDGCIGRFDKNADEYLTKLDKMIIESQLSEYSLDVCVVSGESLEERGDPVNVVFNNRLVRLCCEECVKDFLKEPDTYLKKLDQGKAPEKSPTHQHDHDSSSEKDDHGRHNHGH
ncbi:MAG TPA: hypothetical protein PJ991_12340 [Kiritimatiellia bacterium]|nr:hypothetical protein [Kiritimatiellia bacterium]